MKKNWQSKKVAENCWGLKFTRWYIISPSGNKYFLWRSCYFPTLYVATTYNALTADDKNKVNEDEIKHIYYQPDDPVEENISQFKRALNFIYNIEEKGGFTEQDKMNEYLENNKEFQSVYNHGSYSYNSIPI